MSLATTPRQLNDGTTIPPIGFGTAGLRGEAAIDAVKSALDNGYRLIDTAVNYGNEAEVGEAIRRSGVPRDEIVVTSKIPGRHHAYDDAITSTRESLERLGLDRIDVHLIHWPNPSQEKYHETWRALVQLRDDGLVRSPGVSNFTGAHLDKVIGDTGVTPVLNQIELHPYFPQAEMRAVERRARRPHRVVEPDGQAAGAVRRAGGPGGRRDARRLARPGDPALAAPARLAPDPEVRQRPRGSARTSTSSASSSPTTRSPRSRRSAGRTAGCSAATPTPTRSSDLVAAPTAVPPRRPRPAPAQRTQHSGVGRAAPAGAAAARQDPQVARDRAAAARPGAVGLTRGHARRGGGLRRSTAATTCSSPIPVRVDDGRRAAARPGRARHGSRSAWTRSRARPTPACSSATHGVEVLVEVDSGQHRTGCAARGRGRGGRRRPAGRARGCAGCSPSPGTATPRTAMATAAGGRGPRPGHGARGRRARGTRGRPWSAAAPHRAWPTLDTGVVTEARPGVYVFGDAQQWELGSMPPESIALTCRATVVSHAGGRAVLDAGSKALGADRAAYSTGVRPAARPPRRADRPALGAPRRGRPRRRTAPPARQPARRRARTTSAPRSTSPTTSGSRSTTSCGPGRSPPGAATAEPPTP